jgi:dolichol-phosphate mannosyltransferase
VHVTVVVPTYNEAGNIARLCREVRRACPEADLLIVDDGSPDGTADLAEALDESLGHITVIRRSGKAGLGAAYRAGLRAAIEGGADICVQMDADLSHDPAVLPALIANAEHGADLAIGSRYVPGGLTENWPRRR